MPAVRSTIFDGLRSNEWQDSGVLRVVLGNPKDEHGIQRSETSLYPTDEEVRKEEYRVATSILSSTGGAGRGVLRLVVRPEEFASDEVSERWLHLQTAGISFGHFQEIAIKFAREHDAKLVPVISTLLKEVQRSQEYHSVCGNYIRPGTIRRCDGKTVNDTELSYHTAIFLSMPYFLVECGEIPDAPHDATIHQTRALFQQLYPQENTRQRDIQQVFRKFKPVEEGQYLTVPQLWMLIMGSKFDQLSTAVISCGPLALAETFGSSFEILTEEGIYKSVPRLVHVTDESRLAVFLPMDRCKTFLKLKTSIQLALPRSQTSGSPDDYVLYLRAHRGALTSDAWSKIVEADKETLVSVQLRRRKPESDRFPLPSDKLLGSAPLAGDRSKNEASSKTMSGSTSTRDEREAPVTSDIRTFEYERNAVEGDYQSNSVESMAEQIDRDCIGSSTAHQAGTSAVVTQKARSADAAVKTVSENVQTDPAYIPLDRRSHSLPRSSEREHALFPHDFAGPPGRKVPPFLAWCSERDKEGIDAPLLDPSKDSDIRMRLHLRSIWRKLRPKFPNHLSILGLGGRDIHLEVFSHQGMTFESFQNGMNVSLNHDLSYSVTQEMESLRRTQNRHSDGTDSSSMPPEQSIDKSNKTAKSPALSPVRRVTQWQMAELYFHGETLVNILVDLINFFVPKELDNPALEQCWGYLNLIGESLQNAHRKIDEHYRENIDYMANESFVVKDPPSQEYMEYHNIKPLCEPMKGCTSCEENLPYDSKTDARDHLIALHGEEGDYQTVVAKLDHWLQPLSAVLLEKRNERLSALIKRLESRILKLLTKANDIEDDAATERQNNTNLILPESLVDCFLHVIQLACYTGHSVFQLEKHGELLTNLGSNVTVAEYVAVRANFAFIRASRDLVLMVQTGQTTDSAIHVRATMESSAVLGVLARIVEPIITPHTVSDLYHGHLMTLRLEAGQNPSKRTLRDIYQLQEELNILTSILAQQRMIVFGLEKELSFLKYDTGVRGQSLVSLLQPTIKEYLDIPDGIMSQQTQTIEWMCEELEKIAGSLRRNIEVAEESDSKAIYIFTVVTIIFLPLSFVSSLFGMNTRDIRDMNNTQSLFWAVALPITIAVGGLSIFAAYGVPQLPDWFNEAKKLNLWLRLRTISDSQKKRVKDEEQASNFLAQQSGPKKSGKGYYEDGGLVFRYEPNVSPAPLPTPESGRTSVSSERSQQSFSSLSRSRSSSPLSDSRSEDVKSMVSMAEQDIDRKRSPDRLAVQYDPAQWDLTLS